MNTRRQCLGWGLGLAGLVAAAPGLAKAAPPVEVRSELPDAAWRGTARMRFMGLHLYDLRLWSAQALLGDGGDQPLALELEYARRFKGQSIAERSIEEMRRIGDFSTGQADSWLSTLVRLFPDVSPADRLTGVHLPGQGVRFFFNGQRRGELADGQFARLFFGIWLSPKSSDPSLRRQLLSGSSG